jgi:Domain of unknown function (DUF4412)
MTRLILAALASCALLVACGRRQDRDTTSATKALTLESSSANPMSAAPLPTSLTGKFEGEIVVDVRSGDTQKLPASVTFDIRGDRVRYEPTAVSVHAVDDLDGQHAYVISDPKKVYADIDTKGPAPQVQVERSTKEENVAGLHCEDWTIDDGNEKADVCAAKGIAFFDPAGDAKPGKVEPVWARTMTLQNAFPLRVVVHDRSGKEEYRAQAFEVSWKKVDDSAFQVPAGFKRGDLTSDLKTASLP